MQIARTAPAPTTDWAHTPLGSVGYSATLTNLELIDDLVENWREEDSDAWHEQGASTLRTTGVLGAQEGYATLKEATAALRPLTDDAVADLDEAWTATSSAPLHSDRAAAVLEHDGRYFGYAVDRSFAATEAYEHEPQVEDSALYSGVRYSVDLLPAPDTNSALRAVVDGYDGLWTFGG
ncbi:MAG: hypothetical protein JWM98_904 [Thermoleophilia bacterium]|nr:hypothetical protein [Thermoleophilia bacterium]